MSSLSVALEPTTAKQLKTKGPAANNESVGETLV